MPAIWSQVEVYKGNFLEGKTKPRKIVALRHCLTGFVLAVIFSHRNLLNLP